ncbi:MAG TPA: tripartite tricarboxylate transporter substrate binding protein, partial [Burkholderiales bacterium]|nr:tripartite tricarboxylate transporter substrate binding protein [Burkholderiales bacterium]
TITGNAAAWRNLVYAGILTAVGSVSTADAQTVSAVQYPLKTVRVVVPSAPSGGTDLIARLTAQKVGEGWGQSVIIDNVAGGGTRIGILAVAKAAPDGYTLLLSTTNFAFAPAVYAKLPYDPMTDFVPIVHIANSASLLAVHPSVPATNVAQLVALTRARPAEMRYGYGGAGTVGHLVGALFSLQAGVRFLNVPYKGTGPAITALLSGEIHLLIVNMASLLPHVQSGRLRGLAVAGTKRSRIMPQLPTIAESGVPGYEYSGWYGVWAPAKTPGPIIAKINESYNRVLNDSTVRDRLADAAIDIVGGTSEAFFTYVAGELRKWSRVARETGIQAE